MSAFKKTVLQQFAAYRKLWRGHTFLIYAPVKVIRDNSIDLISDLAFLLDQDISIMVVLDPDDLFDEFQVAHPAEMVPPLFNGRRVLTPSMMEYLQEQLSHIISNFAATGHLFNMTSVCLSSDFIGSPSHQTLPVVGNVDGIDRRKLRQKLKRHQVVLVHPIIKCRDGAQFAGTDLIYVKPEGVATALVLENSIQKALVLSGDVVKDPRGDAISSIDIAAAARVLEFADQSRIDLASAKRARLDLAVDLVKVGVHRVTIIQSGKLLQEIFTTEGAGTMVYSSKGVAACTRVRVAEEQDLGNLYAFLTAGMQAGILLPRSMTQIHERINTFAICEVDDQIIGTAGLRHYPTDRCVEVISLWTATYFRAGVGEQLLTWLESRVDPHQYRQIFACVRANNNHGLTFFDRHGYLEDNSFSAPAVKWEGYPFESRRPVVLVKNI